MDNKNNYIVEFKNIVKSFPGVVALKDVSFSIKKGEIHAIVGENGAGKSTIMKILAGIYIPDSGEIFLDGQPINLQNPREALSHGISMIHQELELVLEMTVEENLFLGREEGSKIGFLNKRKMFAKTKELLSQVNLDINPGTKMSALSVAARQLIEIVKAVSYDASIIIMDEPTSAIGEAERDTLFKIIRSLKDQGKTILYISHKLDEIFEISDSCTILRDGKLIVTKPIKELTKDSMISYMVGRELKDFYTKKKAKIGDIVFEVKDLNVSKKLNNINLNVRKGEILGIAGLVGAGKTEFAETVFGLRKIQKGEIFVEGEKKNMRSPVTAFKNNIGYLTEDRKVYGLNLKGDTRENVSIVNLREYDVLNLFINLKKETSAVKDVIDTLQIKVPGVSTKVDSLSGGNQQKVVIAKWYLLSPNILLMDEPTRGIDVGAKTEIYRIISELAVSGKAIILISSEMEELISMSDRIIVLHYGSVAGVFDRKDFDQEEIMACAAGHMEREEN